MQVAAYPRPTASVINALAHYLDQHGVPTVNMLGVAAPTPAAQTLARDAAALIGSEVAGINLIQHWTTGQRFILDANVNPAIASGVFVEQNLAAYRSYVRDRVHRTAAALEKTRPRRAAPRPSPPGRC